MAMTENEKQAVQDLADELGAAQRIDFGIRRSDGRNIIERSLWPFAVKRSLYDDPEKLREMIKFFEGELERWIKQSNFQGRLLGKAAIEKYLTKSERKDIVQAELTKISAMNKRQIGQRLDIAIAELRRDAGILKADINLFLKNSRLAGLSKKEALSELVSFGRNQEGIVNTFNKRLKSITAAAVRRERTSGEISELRKFAQPKEKWQWIAINKPPKLCPDCTARAGKIFTYNEWVKLGLPGTGRTICGPFCYCKLIPIRIADKRFPTAKEFVWDTKELVLTTPGEERRFRAKSNRP